MVESLCRLDQNLVSLTVQNAVVIKRPKILLYPTEFFIVRISGWRTTELFPAVVTTEVQNGLSYEARGFFEIFVDGRINGNATSADYNFRPWQLPFRSKPFWFPPYTAESTIPDFWDHETDIAREIALKPAFH